MSETRSLQELLERIQETLDRRMSGLAPESVASYASAIKNLAESQYYLNGGSPVSLEKK